MEKEIVHSLNNLLNYIDKVGFAGFDPYDAFNSPLLEKLRSKWLRVAFTVLFRISPINLRRLFRVKKGINPKAMGLFLSSYSRLYKQGLIKSLETADEIFEWLCKNHTKGYSGYCWGYNFAWQDRARLLDRGVPTIVNTSFIGHGILDYYEITKNKKALDVARSACDYILKDLNILEAKNGICFSYTPVDKNIVHNANVLGTSLLARVSSYTNEDILLDYAKKSFDFTLENQQKNGLWAYNVNPKTGKKRYQTDWHQGFILDSLMWFIESINPPEKKYKNALIIGANSYKTQFTDKGICYWRYPRKWPIDIHNQAQGIITFSKLEQFIPGSIKVAEKIAKWTLDNLMDKRGGYFYYEKWPFLMNKIPYIRWGQAWMIYGLATLLEKRS